MLSRVSIKLKVLIAPLAVMLLFIAVSAGAISLLRSQGEAFREVVGGAFDAATASSRMSLAVARIHSDIIRHLDLDGTRQNTETLTELHGSLQQRFERVESMLQSIETNAPGIDHDLLHDLSDLLAVYRIVALRITQSPDSSPTQVSSLMAHYSQLDAYMNRLADLTIRAAKDKQQRTQAFVDRTAAVLALTVFSVFAVGIAATWFIGRAISRPLTDMTKAMTRLAEGDYDIAVPAMGRRDEVGEMADAVEVFRQASIRLHQRDNELAQTVDHLAQARDQAAEASRAKSEFLASMSHELRTPLNAVLGYAQLLQWDAGLSPKQVSGLSTIEKSGQHLLTLIDDILDLAKIEAGKLELNVAPLELQPFLQGIVDIIRVRTQQKGVAFAFDGMHLPGTVLADEKQLRQVLLNLLGNAAKFTDQGSVGLRVQCLSQDDSAAVLHFEVTDSGVGMSADDLKTLFRPFQQVGAVERRRGGTGLGLAISRQLVRLMGGDISVDSELGHGSRFWFELRLPLAAQQPALIADRIATGYEGERKTLLVVDDVDENRHVLVDMLRPLGFLTYEAHNGHEGVERALALKPDMIFMDNVMPIMSGLDATRRLRGMPDFKHVPVIAISASASKADKDKAVEAGATDFLPKPFRAAQLLSLLERYLQIRFTLR
jgi:signal transduction histidine kinase/ActR/RegA family two-component response regulator